MNYSLYNLFSQSVALIKHTCELTTIAGAMYADKSNITRAMEIFKFLFITK